MPRISKKLWILLIVLLIGISAAFMLLKSSTPSKVISPNTDFSGEENPEVTTLVGNLLGTASIQRIIISVGERKVKIEVYDNDTLVASNVFADGIVRPSTQFSLIKIDENDSREYIRWDQYAGPHQVETLILTVANDIVRPVITADYENEQWYMPFWSSRDNTYIGDEDGDGVAEIIEFVDEFPPDAPRLVDSELEKITKNEFPEDMKDNVWRIVSRENYGEGMGRKVIWNIYTLRNKDPLIFQKADREEYERITSSILKATKLVNDTVEGTPEIISRFDLSQDSIDFNNFVRDFWTQGQPYTEPFDK